MPPYTPVCKELPGNAAVRGHRGVDLISLWDPKQTSSLVLPGIPAGVQMSTAALPTGWDPSYSMQLLPTLLPASRKERWGSPVPLSHSASGREPLPHPLLPAQGHLIHPEV